MAKATNKIVVGLHQSLQHAQGMTDYKIEKDVPIPTWITRKYPLAEMQVGDSFLVPTPSTQELRRIRAAACAFGKHNDRLYAVRKDPKKPGSYRCWRKE